MNQKRAEQSGGDNVEATHARGLPSFFPAPNSAIRTRHKAIYSTPCSVDPSVVIAGYNVLLNLQVTPVASWTYRPGLETVFVVSIGQGGDFVSDESGCRTAKKGGNRTQPGYMLLAADRIPDRCLVALQPFKCFQAD